MNQTAIHTKRHFLPALLGATLLPCAGFAAESQTAPARVEDLGASLFVGEAVQDSDLSVGRPLEEPMVIIPTDNPAQRGKWQITPHLEVTGTYDDNIFIQRNNLVEDYVLTFAPGLALGFWNSVEARERFMNYRRGLTVVDRSQGTFLALDYTAALLGFARTSSLNTVNHDARFDARWEREKLALGASFRFETKLEPNADPGRLITRETLSAGLTSRYQLSQKFALELEMAHRTNRPSGLARTAEWRGEGFIDYLATARMRIGLGAAGGLLEVEPGFDQTFERFLVKANYALSEKVDAEFRGGVEFRQSIQPGDRTYPIFDFRARWTPVAGTRVGINAFRNVNKSIFQPERDFTLTGFALTFERALWSGVLVTIDGGYQVAGYIGESRTDDYFFIRPAIACVLGNWGTIGVSYQHGENASSRALSSFESNQVSVEVAVKY